MKLIERGIYKVITGKKAEVIDEIKRDLSF